MLSQQRSAKLYPTKFICGQLFQQLTNESNTLRHKTFKSSLFKTKSDTTWLGLVVHPPLRACCSARAPFKLCKLSYYIEN